MKKILYLHAGAEMYGADKVLLELIKGLDKSVFEAHVILPTTGVLVSALEDVGAKVSVIEYPVLRRKYFNPKGILNYFVDYLKYSKQLLKYVQDQKIDLIHNNTTAILEGIYLKKKAKVPLVWHVHEIIVKPKLISDFINFLMGRYADRIVTVSNAVLSHIEKSPFIQISQTKVIYNGVDSERYYPQSETDKNHHKEKLGIPKTAKVIGMIGRVNSWKGQTDFLSAVTPILEKNQDTYALMVGGVFEGEEWRMEDLKQKVKSTQLSERIILLDFQKDTTSLYNIFDIFVLPSTNPDPLPTVVLEAMACGKPVIAYRHGGVTEMVKEGQNGLFADVGNSNNLRAKINELLDDTSKIERFSMCSRQRQLEHFSLESYITSFTKMYLTII